VTETASTSSASGTNPIVFFDGVCVLCNGFVDWLLRKDRTGVFRFASLQGETANALRATNPELPLNLDAIALWDGSQVTFKSRAVFAITSRLPAPWSWLGVLRFVPRFLSDGVYMLVARTRYALFGKSELCRVPTPPPAAPWRGP
jgi:predicted DCC family thiol-disulfide oxidoreductase YuxK